MPQGVWDTVTQDGKVYACRRCCSRTSCCQHRPAEGSGHRGADGHARGWDQLPRDGQEADDRRARTGWLGSEVADRDRHEPVAELRRQVLHRQRAGRQGPGRRRREAGAAAASTRWPTTTSRSTRRRWPSPAPTSCRRSTRGKFAMVVEGNYAAQQITEEAPKTFNWTVLPAADRHVVEPGRRPADAVRRAVEQAPEGSDAVPGLLHAGEEPRRGRSG